MNMTKPIASQLSNDRVDVLDRETYHEETFVSERNGEPDARPSSHDSFSGATLEELIAAVGDLFPIGDGFADDLEAVQAAQGFIGRPNPSNQGENRQ
ncbi:MAG: hypothetical protein ACR2OO_09075 [Thermomicrobiales bacterium]